MLKYDKDTNAITMVAKDTGDFIVSIDNYLLDNGDVGYFTVNEVLEDDDPKIARQVDTFEEHKAIFHLSSSDTDLPIGSYYYDIQVNTADGRVDTIIGPAKFKIVGGVKY